MAAVLGVCVVLLLLESPKEAFIYPNLICHSNTVLLSLCPSNSSYFGVQMSVVSIFLVQDIGYMILPSSLLIT